LCISSRSSILGSSRGEEDCEIAEEGRAASLGLEGDKEDVAGASAEVEEGKSQWIECLMQLTHDGFCSSHCMLGVSMNRS
jgi:hypothetical protein